MVTITASCAVEDDGVAQTSTPHLKNSSILGDLCSYLVHLSERQYEDVCNLIQSFPSLFLDVPSRTSVLCHDIEVGSASPVKQHPYRVNPKKTGNYEVRGRISVKKWVSCAKSESMELPMLASTQIRLHISLLYGL